MIKGANAAQESGVEVAELLFEEIHFVSCCSVTVSRNVF